MNCYFMCKKKHFFWYPIFGKWLKQGWSIEQDTEMRFQRTLYEKLPHISEIVATYCLFFPSKLY